MHGSSTTAVISITEPALRELCFSNLSNACLAIASAAANQGMLDVGLAILVIDSAVLGMDVALC
jgi:hypothetical protein